MTPAGWRTLATKVAARSVTCGAVPGLVARKVLEALLWSLAGGGEPRSQLQLAGELGVDVRQVRAGIHELVTLGLAWLVQDPEDARKRLPQVNVAQVRAWADGSYVPVAASEEGEIGAENVDSFGSYSGADVGGIGTHPRAGGRSSSSSASTAEEIAAEMAAARALDAAHKRSVQSFRDWGMPMPRGAQRELWDWMRRGFTFEDADEVARACGGAGTRSWNYAVKCIEERMRAADEGRVLEFEQFRGLRPWHGEAK